MSTQQHLSQTRCQPKDPSWGRWALAYYHGDIGELLLAQNPSNLQFRENFIQRLRFFLPMLVPLKGYLHVFFGDFMKILGLQAMHLEGFLKKWISRTSTVLWRHEVWTRLSNSKLKYQGFKSWYSTSDFATWNLGRWTLWECIYWLIFIFHK